MSETSNINTNSSLSEKQSAMKKKGIISIVVSIGILITFIVAVIVTGITTAKYMKAVQLNAENRKKNNLIQYDEDTKSFDEALENKRKTEEEEQNKLADLRKQIDETNALRAQHQQGLKDERLQTANMPIIVAPKRERYLYEPQKSLVFYNRIF